MPTWRQGRCPGPMEHLGGPTSIAAYSESGWTWPGVLHSTPRATATGKAVIGRGGQSALGVSN